MTDNYSPIQPRLLLYPGDTVTPGLVVELVSAFTAQTGQLIGPDDVDRTSLYCSATPGAPSGNQLTGHSIGIGSGTIVPGEYNYYLTGTYDGGQVTTWYWPITVGAKLGGSS
jgi:hypothetical protein